MTFIVPDSNNENNNENNDGNNSEYYSEPENNNINYENFNPIRLGNSNTIPSNGGNNKKNNNRNNKNNNNGSNEEFYNARTNHNIIDETAFENIKIIKNKVNHFFLELYKIKSEYNDEVIKNNSNQNKLKLLKNTFKNKLFSYKYRICQTNLDNIFYELFKNYFYNSKSTSKQIKKFSNKVHSFFLMSDGNDTFSVGITYTKDFKNKDKNILIIKTNDIVKEEYCGIDYLYEFELNDENQMPINTDLKNLINDNTCRKTGLLLPFMWNYIDKFYISNKISTSKNITNENKKDKLYIICTKELYNNEQNTDNKIIINDNIIEQLKNIDLNNENTAKITYSIGIMNKIKQLGNREYSVSNLNLKMMTDIEYKEYSPTIKQSTDIDILNCREYVMRMFGMNIINRLLEKSKSRKEEIDMIKEKHKHKIISEIMKNIPNLNLKYSSHEGLYELISEYNKKFKNRYSQLNASEISDVFSKLKNKIYQKSQNNKKKIKYGKVFVKQDYEKAQQRLNEENIPFDKIQQIARRIAKKINQKDIKKPDFLNRLITNNFIDSYNKNEIIQSEENVNLLKRQIREEFDKIYKSKFMNEKITNLKGFSNKNIDNTLKVIKDISPIITNNNIKLLKKSIKFRQKQNKKQKKRYINKTINEINKLENGTENMIRTLQNLKETKKITENDRKHMIKELDKRITKRYKKEKSEKRKKYIKNKVKKASNTVKKVIKKGKNTMSKLKNKIIRKNSKNSKKSKKSKKSNKSNKSNK